MLVVQGNAWCMEKKKDHDSEFLKWLLLFIQDLNIRIGEGMWLLEKAKS